MIRSLLFIGIFVQGLGCPSPPLPPVVPPTPIVVDAGADVSTCNVSTATQDKITGVVVNACARGASIDTAVKSYNVVDVRCVAADMLLDLRGAPVTEACVGHWLSQHGGAP